LLAIQVALHEPGEVSVEDNALGVSPGVQAIFKIKYFEVSDWLVYFILILV
jgi:hypothetical protein